MVILIHQPHLHRNCCGAGCSRRQMVFVILTTFPRPLLVVVQVMQCRHRLDVWVNKSLTEGVDGLCGRFNMNDTDDLRSRADDYLPFNTTLFPLSWLVRKALLSLCHLLIPPYNFRSCFSSFIYWFFPITLPIEQIGAGVSLFLFFVFFFCCCTCFVFLLLSLSLLAKLARSCCLSSYPFLTFFFPTYSSSSPVAI